MKQVILISGSTLKLDSSDPIVGGNWTNNGTFTHDNRTVTFKGTSEKTIGGSTTTNFHNLTVDSGATVVIPTSNTPTVAGTLTNNGTLKQIRTVDNATVDFLNLKDSAGTTDKYFGVQIATTNNLGSTTVSVSGNQKCAGVDNSTVRRCYTITPTTQAAADIKFYFSEPEMTPTGQPLANQDVWNFHTGAWNAVTRGTDSGTCASGAINCFVQGTGIATYSPFATGPAQPLAVTLADFHAIQQGDAVLVTWETNSELENLGFNLYRGTSAAGPDRQLNSTLIPSQSPGSPGGFIYTWEDRADLLPGTTYYYWVEDVDIHGGATRHGPVSATFTVPTAVEMVELVAGGGRTGLAAWQVLLAALLTSLGGLAWRRRRQQAVH